MKSKVTFLIPYFGILPNYFDLFLKSCEYNAEYQWIVFTDDETPRRYIHTLLYLNNYKREEVITHAQNER